MDEGQILGIKTHVELEDIAREIESLLAAQMEEVEKEVTELMDDYPVKEKNYRVRQALFDVRSLLQNKRGNFSKK